MTETAAQINEAARAWAVRFPLSEMERRDLDAWLQADRRRRGALARALAAWTLLDRAKAIGAGSDDGLLGDNRLPEPSDTGGADHINRRLMLGALGGTVAASVTGAIVLPRLLANRESTNIGEIRRLPLSDGSLATINTDSAMTIDLTDRVREIDLLRGEAWFDVAKDPSRPFVVQAGVARVRAVGTAFSVRRESNHAVVSVTEGVVAVWAEGADGRMTHLVAGQKARIGPKGLSGEVKDASAQIERSLAWRDGEISLEGDTLESAVAEYNRYNKLKIRIDDPGLGQERLVGLFDTNDPVGFADTVAATLGAEVTVTNDYVTLSRLKKPLPT